MKLPSKAEAQTILEKNVYDTYQKHHARMVATAMEGYANYYGEDPHLWYITGLLHDLDFEKYPDEHPAREIEWFREWGYPEELVHAIEAHAYGYNGFTTEPETRMASALLACDEICGIFYAYGKLCGVPYGKMKPSSIKKRLKQEAFAPKIEREQIYRGVRELGIELDQHVENLVKFFADF